MHITLETPNQPEIISLIAELDAYQDSLYPAAARYALDLTALEQQQLLFAVARDNLGTAVGCGAAVVDGAAAELKRMFVRPLQRGQGVAALLLAKLETEAAQRGCRLLQLETGPFQPEALRFYQKHGFQGCSAFGGYPEHPLSLFMAKQLCPN